jgi:hypothetical protein
MQRRESIITCLLFSPLHNVDPAKSVLTDLSAKDSIAIIDRSLPVTGQFLLTQRGKSFLRMDCNLIILGAKQVANKSNK